MRRILLICSILCGPFWTLADHHSIQVLSLAPVFNDHMVLQRNKPVKIFGKAAVGTKVEVHFLNKTIQTEAGDGGVWQAEFPAASAGGPYNVQVTSGQDTLRLKDILVGDVWICSGQSNMDFPLKASKTGPEELKSKSFPTQIRILHKAGIASTYNTAWDSTTLAKVNHMEYFAGNWEPLTAESAATLTAVGYYFGKKVALEQNVPIGLIQVAVGGSPTESWVDTKRLDQESDLRDIVRNYESAEYVMPWCRERIGQNLVNTKDNKQMHPFKPGYNFEAGILPLVQLPIAGVIWYQGESNAHHVAGHARIFETLVDDWRKKWGYTFPFYYVQLSSIDRPLWPEFRDSQRQLLNKIPNAGMAVSLDLGDSLDVHPTQKKQIGERLALQALSGFYHEKITANGPTPKHAVQRNKKIMISFLKKENLKTNDGKDLIGFELIDYNGNRVKSTGIIKKNKVALAVPAGQKIKTVRYAYESFSRANLMNEAGLPASTFSMDIK